MNRRVVPVLVLASVAACRSGAGPRPQDQGPIEVRCEAPTLRSVDDTVALRGRVQPPPGGDLPLASQVAGRIAQVLVREGQALEEGDVVATVDDANTRDVARQADAALNQARATEANAQATLGRTAALVAHGIAAHQELDDATGKAAEARAGVAAATASADLARRTLGRVVVRSSLGGVVTNVWRGAGALVDGTAATPVAQLAANHAYEFVAAVTGGELARVREGSAVHGTLTDGADFDGTVVARGRVLDPSTGLGTVRVALTTVGGNGGGSLREDAGARARENVTLGAYGRASAQVERREGVLTLPTTALRGAVLDGAEVAVCKNGRVEVRKVSVGWRGEERFEVRGGLAPAERVAVEHVLGLEDGAAIAEAK